MSDVSEALDAMRLAATEVKRLRAINDELVLALEIASEFLTDRAKEIALEALAKAKVQP